MEFASLDERRRFEWYMRFGVGATLKEIGAMVGVTAEIIRVDLHKVEARCALHWKKLVTTSPAVRRLRQANALPLRLYYEHGHTSEWARYWHPKPEIPPHEEVA